MWAGLLGGCCRGMMGREGSWEGVLSVCCRRGGGHDGGVHWAPLLERSAAMACAAILRLHSKPVVDDVTLCLRLVNAQTCCPHHDHIVLSIVCENGWRPCSRAVQ